MRLFILVILLLSLTVSATWGQEAEPEILLNLYVGGGVGFDEIARLTQDGLEIITLGGNMALSPDGQFVAYTVGESDDTSIEVYNFETRVDAEFAAVISELREQGYRLWAPYWSPDSQRLAVFAVREGRDSITTVMIDRNEFVDIGIPELRPRGWYNNTQLLADDILNVNSPSEPHRLWLVDTQFGMSVTLLAQRSSETYDEPAVSQNGDILYTNSNDHFGRDIMLLRPGSEPILLVTNASGPVWSPDGRQFAYVSAADEFHPTSGGVWIADARGSNAHPVYRTDHADSYHFSLNWHGDRLYFITGIAVSHQNADESMGDTLVSVRADGQDYRVVYDGQWYRRYQHGFAIR